MPSEFYDLVANSQSTKNIVRRILAENFPLTIKQIYLKIRSDFGKNISYQAVHKMLKELAKDGSVQSVDKKYQINPEWIKKGRLHFEQLEKILAKDKKQDYYEFDCIYDCYRFILEFGFNNMSCINKKTHAALQLEHLYSILTISKEEYGMFENIFRKTCVYIACANNTLLDNALATFYRIGGMKVKLGATLKSDMDVLAINGKVIHIIFPKKLRAEIAKIYSKATVYNILQKNFFYFLYEKNKKIKVIVQENKLLADEIIAQTKRVVTGKN